MVGQLGFLREDPPAIKLAPHLQERSLRLNAHQVYENNCLPFLESLPALGISKEFRSELVVTLCSHRRLKSLLAGLISVERLERLDLTERTERIWMKLFYKKTKSDYKAHFLKAFPFEKRSLCLRYKLLADAARQDQKGKLCPLLLSLIDSPRFPKEDQPDLIGKLFRKYSLSVSLRYIEECHPPVSYLMSFPVKSALNPADLHRWGYQKKECRKIYRSWVESQEEWEHLLARGKRTEWWIDAVDMKYWSDRVFLPQPRKLVKTWIDRLTDGELDILTKYRIWPICAGKRLFLYALNIAEAMLGNFEDICAEFPPERRIILWIYLYRAGEVDYRFALKLLAFLKNAQSECADPAWEFRFFKSLIPRCIAKGGLDQIPYLVERMAKGPYLMEFLIELLNERETLLYIYFDTAFLSLAEKQKMYLLRKTIQRGSAEFVAHVMESLSDLRLTPQNMTAIIFLAMERHSSLELQMLHFLPDYGLSPEVRLSILCRWSEMYLRVHAERLFFADPLPPLEKEEWALLYLDAVPYISDDQLLEFLTRFHSMQFDNSVRVQLFHKAQSIHEFYFASTFSTQLESFGLQESQLNC